MLNNPEIEEHHVEQSGFRLHYRSRGSAQKAVAVWIHGTPGRWSDIGSLFVDEHFLKDVKLVSIDRPGWGESQFTGQHQVLPSFGQQAAYLSPLLVQLHRQYPEVPLILVGHSWGGSLVPYLASENQGIVSAALVLAGGLDPQLSRPRWYNRLAAAWPIRTLIGKTMTAANQEVHALPENLSDMRERLTRLAIPVIVIQGDEDDLVALENADFAEEWLPPGDSRVIRLKGQGHLLQLEQIPMIASCILALTEKQLDQCG